MGSYTLAGGRISNDDEIQFLYKKAPEALLCEMCQADLSRQSTDQKQAHYDRHFSDGAQGSTINVSNTKTGSSKGKWMLGRVKETDDFWHPAQVNKSPPHNFNPGLLPVLRRALIKCHAKNKTQRAVLCYDRTVHISRDFWDAGWGCGYRNYLMVCTALMDQPIQPMYFPLLDDPIPPSVRNLQKTIETAWKEGYDVDGAKDLKNHLVATKKWIGTAELYTAFTYRRIPVQLVDFDLHKEKGVKAVTDWVVEYFSPSIHGKIKTSIDDVLRGASPVTCTANMPLILQHNGHSQTIVGYEVQEKGVVNLLCFDSAKKVEKTLRKAGLAAVASTYMPSASSHKEQPRASSSVLQQLRYPIHKNKRRASDASSPDDSKLKRPRSGPSNDAMDDDVIIIDDPTGAPGGGQESVKLKQRQKKKEPSPEEQLNPIDTVNFFRLDPKALGRKKEYQILYFPLEEPLSREDQLARKEVHSIRIC